MKKNSIITTLSVAIIILVAQSAGAADSDLLKTQADKESYTTGVNIVRNLKQQGGQINLDLVIKGMMDELTGFQLQMTDEELRRTMIALQEERLRRQNLASVKRNEPVALADHGPRTIVMRSADAEPSVNAAIEPKSESQKPADNQADQYAAVASIAPSARTASSASALSANTSQPVNASPANGTSGSGGSGQAGTVQFPTQVSFSPNGYLLSKRNIAKMSISELKSNVRAKAITGDLTQSE